jgi:toxin ParE1/3/4
MASRLFRFHPEAREEFRESIRWYRTRNLPVSTEFRVEVAMSIRTIVDVPLRWPIYLYGARRFILQRFPFSVVYLDDPELITIIAIAHASIGWLVPSESYCWDLRVLDIVEVTAWQILGS